MKRKLVTLLPYAAVLGVSFYLLPLLMRDTGGAMFLMLAVMPLAAFLTGVVYWVRNGFCLLLPAASVILFAPTVLLYYNETAWSYALFYPGIVLAGNGVGRLFYKKR